MASMVAFAMSQPKDVDVNEILFRPTASRSERRGSDVKRRWSWG